MRTLLNALYHHAAHTPTKPAIILGQQGLWTQLSFADLRDETERWARLWLDHCSTPNAVVFLIVQHGINQYPAFLGAMRAGLVPSFLPFPTPKQDPELYWQSHKALFERVNPACILAYEHIVPWLHDIRASDSCMILDIESFAGRSSIQALPRLPDEQNPAHVALLQHSSGTTGLKKGVMLTYEAIRRQLAACTAALAITPADKVISWLPVYHDMGLITAFMLPLSLGIPVISLDAFEWLLQPDSLLDEIAHFRATLCWMPNFAFNHLVRTRDPDKTYDMSSIRAFIDCSEPCKAETMELFDATFSASGLAADAIQTCYGMAEIVFAATHSTQGARPRSLHIDRTSFNTRSEIVVVPASHTDKLTFTSCGPPVEGVSVRIVPVPDAARTARWSQILASLRIVSRGTIHSGVGEIQVLSNFLFDGYFRNEAANMDAFDETWFRSGDMGFMHDGELYVCGRIKEMLIVHGRNFYANDIEEIVNKVHGVKPGRVVALGVYDPKTASEEAMILAETILPDDGSWPKLGEAIRRQVFNTLSLSVRRVEIVSAGTLVKTTSGKISREENVKRLGHGVMA
jgi:fatty-acyl-CoA synthase